MDEKRNFKRVSVDAIVMYQSQDYEIENGDKGTRVDTPESVDISPGGLQIETNQKLPLNIKLQIVLSILNSEVPIQVTGKVIWVHDIGEEKMYKIGIEFLEFDNENNKKLIEEYMNKD